MDSISQAKLQLVNPELMKCTIQLDSMYSLAYPGDELSLVQGLRSWAQQARLYAQGRTAPGAIVTNAPPGHSWHEYGLAVDVCPVSLLLKPGWDPGNPIWVDLANKGRSLGLFPGADFVHAPPDRPHFQLTGRFPASPTDEARSIFISEGIQAVWESAGLFDSSAQGG